MSPQDAKTFPTALTVAEYLLYVAGRDGIDDMDQFKIQKTLYFLQCWSLALRDRPLFADDVQAWRHGPVVRGVYDKFFHRGDEYIEPGAAPALVDLDQDDRDFVESVWHDIKSHSGRDLASRTHQPGPWADTWGDRSDWDRSETTIPPEKMRSHFRARVKSWRR